ncbi:MAG: M23 family metallopeptidase, partial [Actinomycetota bacterium]|nr:M23 family metallopeptidase [Actinomycetota bacterium]
AEASAAARSVSVFDGLVTAYGVRRRAEAGGGRVEYSGSVNGLEVDGRMIGDVAAEERYEIGDGAGTVTVNRGSRGMVVELDRAVGSYSAGSRVIVASVRAEAVDGARPSPTPAPTPGAGAGDEGVDDAVARKRKPKRELERRKAPKIPRRLTAKRFAFPVFGEDARVADDFGADRQIGDHKGNDVFAAFGAPVLAVTDGEIFKVGTLPISGNRLWLRSDAGDEFFYAHLSAFSPAAVNGRRVKGGQVLGFTGNTGDAEPTPPHVHFEIHPAGGKAIDPYEILTAWQDKRDVPPGAWLTRYGSDTEPRPGALVEVRDFIAGE